MALQTIDDAALYGAAAADYLDKADRRIRIRARFVLDMLKLPYPEAASIRPPAHNPAKAVAQAFAADNPQPRTLTYQRKPSAAPERIAALHDQKMASRREAAPANTNFTR